MKLFVVISCFVALAVAKPMKIGDEKGDDKNGGNPVEGLVKLCIGLAEEAVEDADKRSWDDVFGQLAPVCEAILEELEDMDKPKPSGPPPKDEDKREKGDDDEERKGGEGGRKGPKPTGPPPSGAPPKDWLEERRMNEKEGGRKGPKPSGAPPKASFDETEMKGDDDEDRKGGKGGRKGPKPTGQPKDSFEERRMGTEGPKPSGAPPKDWFDETGMGKGKDGEEPAPVEVLLKVCEGLAKMVEKEEEEGVDEKSFEAVLDAMKAVCGAAFARG